MALEAWLGCLLLRTFNGLATAADVDTRTDQSLSAAVAKSAVDTWVSARSKRPAEKRTAKRDPLPTLLLQSMGYVLGERKTLRWGRFPSACEELVQKLQRPTGGTLVRLSKLANGAPLDASQRWRQVIRTVHPQVLQFGRRSNGLIQWAARRGDDLSAMRFDALLRDDAQGSGPHKGRAWAEYQRVTLGRIETTLDQLREELGAAATHHANRILDSIKETRLRDLHDHPVGLVSIGEQRATFWALQERMPELASLLAQVGDRQVLQSELWSRENECAAFQDFLRSDDDALRIVGWPGSGKSRLTLKLAELAYQAGVRR